jgi:large subunit ribosomal protein L29
MELEKIRNLSDAELTHQEKTAAEQLFRLRFQVSLGQNDGMKKIRELRKEIAQIKTVARERELEIHGETSEPSAPAAAETKAAKTKPAETKAAKAKPAKTKSAETKAAKAKSAKTKSVETGKGASK